jgi:tRNA (guanine-N7-)-methyltransferase
MWRSWASRCIRQALQPCSRRSRSPAPTTCGIVHGDAVTFLDRVPPGSLTGVQILYPDPWPKVRHHHRRLVAGDIVAAVTDRLRHDGWLHLATDIADYAEAMRAAVATEPRLSGGVVARPSDRPVTRFEQRGLDEGRTSIDLQYHRTS